MLASLLKQLARGLPSIPDILNSLFESHRRGKTRPSIEEISRVLQSVVAIHSRTFIIIDALDEYQLDGGRSKFLSEIFTLQEKANASVFATSRYNPENEKAFKGSSSLEIRASDEDVQKHLDQNMSRLPLCVSRNLALQEKIRAEIIKAVDGMYEIHVQSK
jgi:hypothetical protein